MNELDRLKKENAGLKRQLENQYKKNGAWTSMNWQLKVSIFCIVVSLICIVINVTKILCL